MANVPGDALKTGAKELLETSLFSDLTIKCRDKDFKVHKAILFPQSKYFQKLLGGKFRESKENQSSISLDEDPVTFGMLIQYLYTFSMPATVNPRQAVEVYMLADKYDVPPLRLLAASRFKNMCEPELQTDDFISAVYAVNDCTVPHDPTLWDIVVPLIKSNMGYLLTQVDFKTLIKDLDDLNFRLLSAIGNPSQGRAHKAAWSSATTIGHNSDDSEDDSVAIGGQGGGRILGGW